MKITTQDVFVLDGESHFTPKLSIMNETQKTDILPNEQSSWGTKLRDLLQSACMSSGTH